MRVGSSPSALGDLWDSGERHGNDSVLVPYEGAPLASRMQCWWTVDAWGRRGRPATSPIARWSMGLLHPADWTASWIGLPADPEPDGVPVVLLRRPFTLDAAVERATLSITALGVYRAFLNAAPVSADRFTPGWTDYRTRVQYRVYDVHSLMRPGDNELLVELGGGWYCGHVGPERGRAHYGGHPMLLAQLEADGVVVGTDGEREAAVGPRRWSVLLMGEAYDARRRPLWGRAKVFPAPQAALVATTAPSVRVLAEAPAERLPGTNIYDAGFNMAGWARVSLHLPAGETATLRFGEALDDDGRLYTANLRDAAATDSFTSDGAPAVFEPAFTSHGFRYIEIDGADDAEVAAVAASSAARTTGTFTCSNPLVDRIVLNTMRSQWANTFDIPTDCPQRDERLGWLGDATVFAGTAAWLMDVAPLYTKWLVDVEDAKVDGGFGDVAPLLAFTNEGAPGWGDAGIEVPWVLYERYGDRRVLERQYPSMKAWVERIERHNPGLLWEHRVGNDYGDWLCIDEITSHRVVSTAFFARSTSLLAAIARVLGLHDDAVRFGALFDGIAAAFNQHCLGTDGWVESGTQTAYALALRLGLLSGRTREQAAERLAANVEQRGHLTTGFMGVRHLLPALTDAGRVDLAYRLLESERFPSWGYCISQGATSMWERWDGRRHDKGFADPLLNSFNHTAFGSVVEWLFDTAAGIRPMAPGFARVRIAPRPGGSLTHAAAQFDSVRGRIASRWQTDGGDKATFEVDVPANVAAEFVMPPEWEPTKGDRVRPLAPGRHTFAARR